MANSLRLKPGDLVRVITSKGSFGLESTHSLYGNNESPMMFLKEEGYDILIATSLVARSGELCIVLKIEEQIEDKKRYYVRILKNNGESGWLVHRHLEKGVP